LPTNGRGDEIYFDLGALGIDGAFAKNFDEVTYRRDGSVLFERNLGMALNLHAITCFRRNPFSRTLFCRSRQLAQKRSRPTFPFREPALDRTQNGIPKAPAH
jgi:hypothetical protein